MNFLENMQECQKYSNFKAMDDFLLVKDQDICNQFIVKNEFECQSNSSEQNFKTDCSEKVAEKSKRIQKRQQAKIRNKQVKQKESLSSIVVSQEHSQIDMLPLLNMNRNSKRNKEKRFELPDDFHTLNPSLKKKLQQKIKNRISAQNSRDKQRVYIKRLEQDKEDLVLENQALLLQIQQQQQLLEQQQQDKVHRMIRGHSIPLVLLLFVIFALFIALTSNNNNINMNNINKNNININNMNSNEENVHNLPSLEIYPSEQNVQQQESLVKQLLMSLPSTTLALFHKHSQQILLGVDFNQFNSQPDIKEESSATTFDS